MWSDADDALHFFGSAEKYNTLIESIKQLACIFLSPAKNVTIVTK